MLALSSVLFAFTSNILCSFRKPGNCLIVEFYINNNITYYNTKALKNRVIKEISEYRQQ